MQNYWFYDDHFIIRGELQDEKNKMIVCAVMLAMLGGTMTSFAGEWKENEKGYWHEKDDGGY